MKKKLTQKEKSKFRSSAKWYRFRAFMKNLQNGNDYISGLKLPKGANLHHMDEANYTDLNPDKFVFLGREMHKTVHFLYRYFRKDRTCIDRLVFVLEKMKKYEEEAEK